jgi:hypothetical protein
MQIKSDDISTWADNLDDFKPDYTPIKCWSVLQFFKLKGKRTVMSKDNIENIKDLHYCIFSEKEKRYYFRAYHDYNLMQIYFYRKDLDFSGSDTAIESLRRYVYDGNVYLLLTNEQVEETKVMLQRVWNSQFKIEGKLDYRIFIQLLDTSLKLEDYKEYGSNLTGFRTVCNQMETHIRELWQKSLKN